MWLFGGKELSSHNETGSEFKIFIDGWLYSHRIQLVGIAKLCAEGK